jgi:hypothetical protein
MPQKYPHARGSGIEVLDYPLWQEDSIAPGRVPRSSTQRVGTHFAKYLRHSPAGVVILGKGAIPWDFVHAY